MGPDREGSGRPSGQASVLDTVRNVAPVAPKQVRSKADRVQAHAERVWRARAILRFIRDSSKNKYPDFLQIAHEAKQKNELFPDTQRKTPDIAQSMRMLWMKRVYWESDEAFKRQLHGGNI